MIFDYLTGGSLDLFNLIFNQLLKISPTLLYKYTTLQDQVLNLILLPHVILFLFLLSFGYGIVSGNKGLRYLVMIVTYIFIVTQGWYGTFLVPLLQAWFWIMLVAGLFAFFAFKIIHPVTAGKIGDATAKLAYSAGKNLGKEKQIYRLAEELENIEKQMRYYEGRKGDVGTSQVLHNLENRKFEIVRKIKDLEK